MSFQIPHREMRAYAGTVRQAVRLAHEGEPEYGEVLLEAALRLAEETEQSSEPWAGELTQMYRRALTRYQQRYGGGASP